MYDFLSGSRWCGIYRSGISGISISSGGAAGYQLDSGESSGFLGRTEGNAGRSQSQRESI